MVACGLVVGSYLNVVIVRLPRRESTVLPRSRCPSCGALIRARDNIPLLSFLLLGGRCRSCRAPIAWRYPLVEAATGLTFALAALRFGPQPEMLSAVTLVALLLALALIDLEHFLLPDRVTLTGLLLGFALAPFTGRSDPLVPLAGALLGAGLLLSVALGGRLLLGEEAMGEGDVKMLAMIGAFLGWRGVIVTLVSASLVGSLVAIPLLATGHLERRSRLPFGAFLAAGGLLALFAGQSLVAAYEQLLP